MNDKLSKISEIVDNISLNEYIKQLNEDTTITKYNLKEKSFTVSALRCKWLSFYKKENENLSRLKEAKDKLLKSKLSNVQNKDSVLRLKSEESIVNNDEKIQKINKLMTQTKDIIDFLERAMNILDSMGYDIKNITEIIKLSL